MSAQTFYGWRLLGAFWLIGVINLAFPAYGSAVLNAAMAAELGFGRQSLGTMVAVYLAMSGLPAPLVAASVKRVGVRWTLVIGSAFVVTGAVMLATVVDTVAMAVLAFGVLVGIGVATGAIIAAQAGVARWFVRRRALAFSLLYSSGAIGGFIAPPLLSSIASASAGSGQWRLGWWLMAALSVIAALIAIATVREQPSDLGQAPDGDFRDGCRAGGGRWNAGPANSCLRHPHRLDVPRGAQGPVFLDDDHAVHRRECRLCALPRARRRAPQGPRPLHAGRRMGDQHDDDQRAPRKVIIAVLGDRIDPRYFWALFCATFGVGMILLSVRRPRRGDRRLDFLGMGFGGGLVAMMATLSNYYGTSVFPSLSGLAIAINTGICSLAPIIAGRMYDAGLGYSAYAFWVIAAWCIAGRRDARADEAAATGPAGPACRDDAGGAAA